MELGVEHFSKRAIHNGIGYRDKKRWVKVSAPKMGKKWDIIGLSSKTKDPTVPKGLIIAPLRRIAGCLNYN